MDEDALPAWVRRFRRRPSERATRVLLLVAGLGLTIVSVMAASALQLSLDDVRWPTLFAAALIGVPLGTALNAGEYVATARYVGVRPGWVEALEVTTLASAANLLPVPGAALVRVQALMAHGVPLRAAGRATVIVAVFWLAVSLGAAALGAWAAGAGAFAAACAASAVGAATLGIRLSRDSTERWRIVAFTLTVEALTVAGIVLRLWLVIAALGVDGGLRDALVLALSVAVASAIGFLPGGLGARELIAAALAPLVGMSAAAGLLVSTVNRVLGTAVLAPIALGVAYRRRGSAVAVTPSER